ncbi:MAG: hypothetical protein ACXVQY_03795 [Actinomycetota bacterium]
MSEQMVVRADEQTSDETEERSEGLRFDDPYWDDAFCAWWDPTLRTCCS